MTRQRAYGLLGVLGALVLAAAAVALMLSRGGSPPDDVARQYLEAGLAGNAAEQCRLTTPPLREVRWGSTPCEDAEATAVQPGEVTVHAPEVDPESGTATVGYRIDGVAGVSGTLDLVMVDDNWAVAADSAAP